MGPCEECIQGAVHTASLEADPAAHRPGHDVGTLGPSDLVPEGRRASRLVDVVTV